MSSSDAAEASVMKSPAQRPPRRSKGHADRRSTWLVAGLIGVTFVLFLRAALQLPTDIRRWPMSLAIVGLMLLGFYGLQQVVLARDLKIFADLRSAKEAADALGPTLGSPMASASAGATEQEQAAAEEARDSMQFGNAEDYTRTGDVNTAKAALIIAATTVVAYGFGFMAAALLIVPLFSIVNGERSPLRIGGTTLGTALAVYALFGSVLAAPLTRGAWYRPTWLTSWIPF